MSEHKIQEWLVRKGTNPFVVKRYDVANFSAWNVNPDLPQDVKDNFRAQIQNDRRCRSVFVQDSRLPPPLKAKPHVIKLKPDATPKRCPKPKFGYASKKYSEAWARKELSDGAYEHCNGAWASRMHLAWKAGKKGKLDPEFEIRDCGDYVSVNTCIEKLAPENPSIEELASKFAKATHFWEADAIDFYRQYELDEKSRDILAVWTVIGLLRPTRVPFGMINSGTVLTSYVQKMLRELTPEQRELISAYCDDFLGGVVELRGENGLVASCKRFLLLCHKHGISLKLPKFRFGYTSAKYAGLQVGDGTVRMMDDAMQPVQDMIEPHDKTSVRSALGIFNGSARMIPGYSIITRPLTRLTGNVPWQWGEEEKALLNQVCYKRGTPLALVSDADPALMAAVTQQLIKCLKITHLPTYLYPQGNSVTERHQLIIGENLRMLELLPNAKEVRNRWPELLPRWEFAVNSTVNETTSLTPFQIEYGRMPRMPFEQAMIRVTAEKVFKKRSIGEFARMKELQAMFQRIALRSSLAARMESNAKLNRAGGPKIEYKIGDLVSIWLPPRGKSQNEDQKQRKKHKLWWRGPCKVIKRISLTWYECLEMATGRVFPRNITNMNYWHVEDLMGMKQEIKKIKENKKKKTKKSTVEAAETAEAAEVDAAIVKAAAEQDTENVEAAEEDTDIEAADETANNVDAADEAAEIIYTSLPSGVLVVQAEEKNCFELAIPMALHEAASIKVHYLGTTDSTLSKARFKRAWIEVDSGETMLADEGNDAKVGIIPTSHILLDSVILSKSGRLKHASRKRIESLQMQHIIL